jgi:transposase-like protein
VPPPLSDRKRRAVLADIEAGQKSAHQIARDHGVAQSTVSKVAREEGHSFDRAKTKKATAAKQVDHKARLVAIAGRTASVAEDVLTSFEDMTTEDWRKVSPYSRGLIVHGDAPPE